MSEFMRAAIEEAQAGLLEGGIPVGSVIVIDGHIVGRGRNRRIQRGSSILHAEMDCIENAGLLTASEYRRASLYTTLSPCDMCSGAMLLYRIKMVVIGENTSFHGPEEYLRSRGVQVRVLGNGDCIEMMSRFIARNPDVWHNDIGEL